MKFVITIDVEEDNWGEFTPIGYSLENIKKLPGLQKLFDQYDVKPTYLINYPVATDKFSIKMFKSFLAEGKCEIGMHCHPWNTPPNEEEITAYNSMMSNLPEDLQFRKLQFLKKTIEDNLSLTPVSYRSGRWAFHEGSARALMELGFKVDTSMMAYTDWSEFHGVDYSDIPPQPFRFTPDRIFNNDPDGGLVQVPATVGYLQRDFSRANRLYKSLNGVVGRGLRLKWIFQRLGALNRVSLSPEITTCDDMKKLVNIMAESKVPVLNMFFHSTALKEGLSPFVLDAKDVVAFMERIEEMLVFFKGIAAESITLSQFDI